MAAAVGLIIVGILFYFIKYGFNRVVLKKSEDQIRLEELIKKQHELIYNKSLFTSKEKNDAEIKKLKVEINALKNKMKDA